MMLILVSGCSALRASMLSRTEHMIDCPDCLCGLVVAVIAAWLSVYMLQVEYFLGLECTMSTASLMATSSAAYTFCAVVAPRYCCFVSANVGLYAAAPIWPSIPDPSVYTLTALGSCVRFLCFCAASSLLRLMSMLCSGIHQGGLG